MFKFPSPSGDHAFSNEESGLNNEMSETSFRPLQGIMHLATFGKAFIGV